MHPTINMSAIPMGLSLDAWESDDYQEIAKHLIAGAEQVARAGADFFLCPDNTAHIVLEQYIEKMPLPGLHIAEVVCAAIKAKGWTKVGLLGTKWTMTGPVYAAALEKNGQERIVPNEDLRMQLNAAIFEELCLGVFKESTTNLYIQAIEELKQNGAECVILGCTEIPLIINDDNSPLPTLDSTRLLAKYAVKVATSRSELPDSGWIDPGF